MPVHADGPGSFLEGEGTIEFADHWASIYCPHASALLTVDAVARVATYTVTFPHGCELAQAWYLQAVGTQGLVFALVWGSWDEGFTGTSGVHALTILPPDNDGSVVVWGTYFWPIAEPFFAGGRVQASSLG